MKCLLNKSHHDHAKYPAELIRNKNSAINIQQSSTTSTTGEFTKVLLSLYNCTHLVLVRNCHIRMVLLHHPSPCCCFTSSLYRSSPGPSKRPSGALSASLTCEPGLARLIQSHFRREGGCGELGKPNRPDERCPNHSNSKCAALCTCGTSN